MKDIYIVKIYGNRDFNLIPKYLKEKLFWKTTRQELLKFNPYNQDVSLDKDSSIVLIIDFKNKEIEYTYPIQFDFLFKKIERENKDLEVKKLNFDEFFNELKDNFINSNKKSKESK